MEFIYDPNTCEWTRKEAKECAIVFGNTRIPIPNFYATLQDKRFNPNLQTLQPNPRIWFCSNDATDITPKVEFNEHYLGCNITTGQWTIMKSWSDVGNVITRYIVLYQQRELSDVCTRLAKLEAVFDHIREKSSSIDEFMKIAENVKNV